MKDLNGIAITKIVHSTTANHVTNVFRVYIHEDEIHE